MRGYEETVSPEEEFGVTRAEAFIKDKREFLG